MEESKESSLTFGTTFNHKALSPNRKPYNPILTLTSVYATTLPQMERRLRPKLDPITFQTFRIDTYE